MFIQNRALFSDIPGKSSPGWVPGNGRRDERKSGFLGSFILFLLKNFSTKSGIICGSFKTLLLMDGFIRDHGR